MEVIIVETHDEETKVASSENKEQEEQEHIDHSKKSLWKKIQKLESENEKLKADAEHWKNEYYRAYADTKNLRTSLENDHKVAMKYRAESFIDGLLPVLDSFHMALANEPADPNLKNYLVGFQYIYRNFVAALENEGVTEISPKVGDKFDASVMNGVDSVETDGEENKVMKIYTKGYKLHDRLIRPANVSVSVKKKENNDENHQENKIDA